MKNLYEWRDVFLGLNHHKEDRDRGLALARESDLEEAQWLCKLADYSLEAHETVFQTLENS